MSALEPAVGADGPDHFVDGPDDGSGVGELDMVIARRGGELRAVGGQIGEIGLAPGVIGGSAVLVRTMRGRSPSGVAVRARCSWSLDNSVAVITKVDIAEAVEFDFAAAEENIQRVRPGLETFRVSAKTGHGLAEYLGFLEARMAEASRTVSP